MPLNFPYPATTGQNYTYNNRVYTFNGSTWALRSTPTIVSEIEPTLTETGDLWFNPTNKILFIRDGTEWRSFDTALNIIYPDFNGEASYTSPGTYSWTCPAGVYWVHAVCVGGGGGGFGSGGGGAGGGGGGLAWNNDIPVIPGQSYAVVVGAGTSATTTSQLTGESSFFNNASTVIAYGGKSGISTTSGAGGAYYPYGGIGGAGGSSATDVGGGGGGAGGYSGTGGAGGGTSGYSGTSGAGGGGGGGGGGANSVNSSRGGGGGGVGIYGQGPSGVGGATSSTASPGTGGSSGASGVGATGGLFGGGGGGADNTGATPGAGQGGAVRIIWGPNRAFPYTNVGVL